MRIHKKGSVVDIKHNRCVYKRDLRSFADIQGSFVDIQGSFADTQEGLCGGYKAQ